MPLITTLSGSGIIRRLTIFAHGPINLATVEMIVENAVRNFLGGCESVFCLIVYINAVSDLFCQVCIIIIINREWWVNIMIGLGGAPPNLVNVIQLPVDVYSLLFVLFWFSTWHMIESARPYNSAKDSKYIWSLSCFKMYYWVLVVFSIYFKDSVVQRLKFGPVKYLFLKQAQIFDEIRYHWLIDRVKSKYVRVVGVTRSQHFPVIHEFVL